MIAPRKLAPQKGRCPESIAEPGKVTPLPTRPGSAPQEWGTHLVVCYQGQHLIHEVDCKVQNLVEQSNAPGEERKLIKFGKVGRAAKQEQWEEGRRR